MRSFKVHAGRRHLAVAAVAALTCALAACSSGPSADGPLSSGSSIHGPIPRGAICVPGGRDQTFGDQIFTNYGDATVILDRVAILHPRDEKLIGSFAVPGALAIGTVTWPPNYPHMPSGWKHRQPVHGFRLKAGRTFNMVLGVAATTRGRATSQGILVYYHDSSNTYVAKNYFANDIDAIGKDSC
jgi:hypothetical protein